MRLRFQGQGTDIHMMPLFLHMCARGLFLLCGPLRQRPGSVLIRDRRALRRGACRLHRGGKIVIDRKVLEEGVHIGELVRLRGGGFLHSRGYRFGGRHGDSGRRRKGCALAFPVLIGVEGGLMGVRPVRLRALGMVFGQDAEVEAFKYILRGSRVVEERTLPLLRLLLCGNEREGVAAQVLDHQLISGLLPVVGLVLAVPRIIGAGEVHRLARRGDQQLEHSRFVAYLIKYFIIQLERTGPVVLLHEGQQFPELCQKSLFVNRGHLQPVFIVIIPFPVRLVKINITKKRQKFSTGFGK